MADKLTPLVVAALTRAATAPAGTPLTGPKASGLFPNTAAAKPAMTKAVADGLLAVVEADRYAATPAGLDFLARQGSPKQVLDDFVRVLENREAEVANLVAAATRLADEVSGMRAAVGRFQQPTNGKPRTPPPFDADELADATLARLTDWGLSAAAGQDCPLPDLYRSLACREAPPTVGQFHDCLRALHAANKVYLHPWTGPLYAVPEPTFALLAGHNVAYYASSR